MLETSWRYMMDLNPSSCGQYRGKRDEKLILPLNSSVSVTLSQKQLRAKTTIAISKNFKEDCMWLNGSEQCMKNPRLQAVISQIKRLSRKRRSDDPKNLDEKLQWKLHICSENNFPTSAGLASSAAGFACLVFALAKLYGVEGDLSEIARQGSGSACRSIYGGFVVWNKGQQADGSDSKAKQIASETHWPELHVLILIVSDQTKHTGSTAGMKTTVATSELLQQRLKALPTKTDQITQAILEKDFQIFAEITMKESNQLHAVCLDTFPPISYLTDVSFHIIQLIHAINKQQGLYQVAYTFDAGPNAFLFMLQKDVQQILEVIGHFYPSEENIVRGISAVDQNGLNSESKIDLDAIKLPRFPRAIKELIHTMSGPGPCVVENNNLLNEDGMPLI